jgi:hypothetical protein
LRNKADFFYFSIRNQINKRVSALFLEKTLDFLFFQLRKYESVQYIKANDHPHVNLKKITILEQDGVSPQYLSNSELHTVAFQLKTMTAEPEYTAVVRQCICKHVSTASKSRQRDNGYARNNRGITGSDVFCWVRSLVVRESPPGGGMEVEKPPLLKTVA